ncbi:MAG: hypothetical protein LBN21_08385, partial [Treponema sp.]|nr:hypothetical protein [Treponema sp.]
TYPGNTWNNVYTGGGGSFTTPSPGTWDYLYIDYQGWEGHGIEKQGFIYKIEGLTQFFTGTFAAQAAADASAFGITIDVSDIPTGRTVSNTTGGDPGPSVPPPASLTGTTWTYTENGFNLIVYFTANKWFFTGTTDGLPKFAMWGTYTIASPGNIVFVPFDDLTAAIHCVYTDTILDMTMDGGEGPDHTAPFAKQSSNPIPLTGTWVQEGQPNNSLVFEGNTYTVIVNGSPMKRCIFTLVGSQWEEIIVDDFNDGSAIGDSTTVTFTLVGTTLTITDPSQVWHKQP